MAATGKLKAALRSQTLSLGAWVQIGHPACGEIFAEAGFDWVCVDLEHGAIGIEAMTDVFRAVERHGSTPVARVPANDPVWIRRTLDAGAHGIIVPMVNTQAEAENAVAAAKFPPHGQRGYGYCRANDHGAQFAAYAASANRDLAMIAQIEHKDAMANLESIAAVNGIDGLFIGPYDLSGSMGIPGELADPRVTAALDRFLNVCRDRKMPAGMHIVHPTEEAIGRAITQGYTLVALGVDTVLLRESSRQWLDKARQPRP